MSEGESQLNALEENIARKGNNAYYYAHQQKANGPQWDGDATPRLLERQVSSPAVSRHAITQYSWLDDDAKVKIYIPFDADDVRLEFTETTLSVYVKDRDSVEHVLRIPKLYDKIEKATHRVKTDKIVVTLFKLKDEGATPMKWWDLKK